ncbi:MAG TPA: tRNA pseudouridine(13) synthase TruD [Polyangia bacterium]|nr:tRNA pseudouridine(13) synthase TruD [Polyangia bacterium]
MTLPEWPRLLDVPALPAAIKERHEDFVVEELPAYEPCGEGDHVYLRVEKRGMTTGSALRALARSLDVRPRDVGVAGQKDARGVTVQTFSIEHVDPAAAATLELPGLRVLEVARHRNKLRTGHLRGNRFAVRLREVDATRVGDVRAALAELEQKGAPNYFGPQRFGTRGDTWEVGRAALAGDFAAAARIVFGEVRSGDPRRAILSQDRRLLSLYASAFQSYLFNNVVARRLGSLGRVGEGDLAWKHDNGAVFRVTDAAADQPRAESFEISPTGPMYGRRMTEPGGEQGALEAEILAGAEITADAFPASGPFQCAGGRRPLRDRPEGACAEAGVDEHGPFIEVRFGLDPGCYATVVLAEICGGALSGA